MKRIRWNDELIEHELIKVVSEFGADGYMPTSKQVTKIYGNYGLANAISRNGGFVYWAERLGLLSQSNNYTKGLKFEKVAEKTLLRKGYSVETTGSGHPYDLYVGGSVKVDVKSSTPTVINGGRVHVIGINKEVPTCDIYIVYCVAEDGVTIEKELVIPSHMIKMKSLNMGKNSKYNIYENRYDFIEKYRNFMSELL